MIPAGGEITVSQAPQNVTAPQNNTIMLSVTATSTNTPMLVQWQRNGVTVPGLVGATVQYGPLAQSDNGAKFRAVISTPGATTNTTEATITVTSDVTPPRVTGITGSESFNSVTIDFSEAVTAASAGKLENYTFDKGLAVTAAQVVSPTRVRLTTGTQTQATAYTLSITNILDTAGVASAASSGALFTSFGPVKGGLKFEAWNGITGTAVDLLKNDPKYLEPADFTGYIKAANSRLIYPDDSHGNYGARITGWLVPTETASYDFMVRSDDASELSLSTDDTAANLQIIAEESGCCGGFEEPGGEATTATPIALVAGRRYFFQLLYKEGGGGDFGAVAWRKVGDATPAGTLQPIPGSFFEITAMPGILNEPIVSFTAPAEASVFPEGTPIVLNVAASAAPGKTITRVEIFQGATRIADLSAGPFTTTVTGLAQNLYTFSARATDSAGLYTNTPPLSVSVGQKREVRNLVMINDQTTWRFDRTGADLGIDWRTNGFNDSAFQTGKALIADETGDTVEPIRTPIARINDLGEYVRTFYFRTTFNWTSPTNDVKLALRHVIDDGAVVYLNGVEVHRFNIAADVTVDFLTDATGHEQRYEGPFDITTIGLPLLRQGENLLAVEVHQSGGSSSDMVFGAELTASAPVSGPAERPRFTKAELVGGSIRLEWINGGTLQSRTSLDSGAWTDIPGATSGYTSPADGSMKFFQVRQ